MPTNSRFWALEPEAAQTVFPLLRERMLQQFAPDAMHIQPPLKAAAGYAVSEGVAVIPVDGPITRTTRYWDGQSYTCGQNDIAAALGAALADASVKAILLNINSPGGIVPGTKELADAILAAAQKKPMAAYANGLMASAAMWLASATGRVYAPVTAEIGSVGVLLLHADFSGLNAKWGVTYTYITAGKLKSAGNRDEPLSDEARALFQKQATEIHDIFKADVVRGLGVTAPAEAWAEGQTMLAGEARNLGLVTDIVRDLSSAITKLRLEATMDYATLAARHPELLAEITARAEAAAVQKLAAVQPAQPGFTQDDVFALVSALAGEEATATVGKLMESGFSLAQVQTLAGLGMLAKPGAETRAEEKPDMKAALLAALQKATPSAVEGTTPPPAAQKSPLVADAEKRAMAVKA